MRAPIWHLRNNFWRWWYAGRRWTRWLAVIVSVVLIAALAITLIA